jgi:hypothetical protein
LAGLVPAIHVLSCRCKVVDARDKPGHDDNGELIIFYHAPTNFGTTVPFL